MNRFKKAEKVICIYKNEKLLEKKDIPFITAKRDVLFHFYLLLLFSSRRIDSPNLRTFHLVELTKRKGNRTKTSKAS